MDAPIANQDQNNEVWWIDTDPGTDDAVAIAIMLAHKNVVGISISLGNGTLELCSHNAAKILGVLKTEVPVYKGSSKPMTHPEFIGTDAYFGTDALGDTEAYKDFKGYTHCEREENGHFALIEASKAAKKKGQTFNVLTLAPLTTIGVALAMDSSLAKRIDSIFIMGGAADGQGFTKPSTEFNFDRDPEAAYKVLNECDDAYVLPIDTWETGVFSLEELDKLRNSGSEISRFFKEITRHIALDKDDTKLLNGPLFDPMCAAAVVDRSIMKKVLRCHATVDIEGNLTSGALIIEHEDINPDHDKYLGHSTKKWANIILEIDHQKYMDVLYSTWKHFS